MVNDITWWNEEVKVVIKEKIIYYIALGKYKFEGNLAKYKNPRQKQQFAR